MSEQAFIDWVLRNEIDAEWVDGEVIVSAPATFWHQDLVGWVYNVVSTYVERRCLGKAVVRAFSVLSTPRREIRVPDVLFISNDRLAQLDKGDGPVQGSPDLIMEIVSGDSAARDWREKYASYQAAGVREYWVIDSGNKLVEAYKLESGAFAKIEPVEGKINSVVVAGWFLRPQWLWQQPRPIVLDVLPELGIK